MRALLLGLALVFGPGIEDDPMDYYYFPQQETINMVDAAWQASPQDRCWTRQLLNEMQAWRLTHPLGNPMPWHKNSFDAFRDTFPNIVGW